MKLLCWVRQVVENKLGDKQNLRCYFKLAHGCCVCLFLYSAPNICIKYGPHCRAGANRAAGPLKARRHRGDTVSGQQLLVFKLNWAGQTSGVRSPCQRTALAFSYFYTEAPKLADSTSLHMLQPHTNISSHPYSLQILWPGLPRAPVCPGGLDQAFAEAPSAHQRAPLRDSHGGGPGSQNRDERVSSAAKPCVELNPEFARCLYVCSYFRFMQKFV